MADLSQANLFQLSTAETHYPYVEMQQATGEYEETVPEASLVEIFSALVIPVILLGGLVWLVKRATKQTRAAVQSATENTAVVARNNELLLENIALQKEILTEMRKRNSGG
ncbi:MAG: hypothetical protein AAF171_15390 [Cyanobacteria bacterium P01_A01_bin.116]